MPLINGSCSLHFANMFLSGFINGNVNGTMGIWINDRGLFRTVKIKDALFDHFSWIILNLFFSFNRRKLRLFYIWFMRMVAVIEIGDTYGLTNFTFVFIGVSTCLHNCAQCLFYSFLLTLSIFSAIHFLLTLESQ